MPSPAGFFEDKKAGTKARGEVLTGQLNCASMVAALPAPAGFFEDKKADAKARGEVPKSQKDMTKVCWPWR